MSKRGMSFMELVSLFRTNPGCFWGVHIQDTPENSKLRVKFINKGSNLVTPWNGQRVNNQFYSKVECVFYVSEKPFVPKNGYYGKNLVIVVPKGPSDYDWYCYLKHENKWVFCKDKNRIANYLRTTKFLAFTSSKEMSWCLGMLFFDQKELKLFKAKFYEDKK